MARRRGDWLVRLTAVDSVQLELYVPGEPVRVEVQDAIPKGWR